MNQRQPVLSDNVGACHHTEHAYRVETHRTGLTLTSCPLTEDWVLTLDHRGSKTHSKVLQSPADSRTFLPSL